MERFFWHTVAIPTYFLGFVPLSGFVYYPLNNLVQKWGDRLQSKGK